MRVLLTGVTGLLGRNILFELLKQYLNCLDHLEIFVIGRQEKECSLLSRIKKILINDGLLYLQKESRMDIIENIMKRIYCITIDFLDDNFEFSIDTISRLKTEPIDMFFHIAASTDFRDSKDVCRKLHRINYEGTDKLLRLLAKSGVQIIKSVYTGTVYSCGKIGGIIQPDYTNLQNEFRNPYEKNKLQTEMHFMEFFKDYSQTLSVMRISTICGRLIEPPLGAVCKYDVMYLFGAYVLHLKLKAGIPYKELLERGLELDLRLPVVETAGLNIVPADFAAKEILAIAKHAIKSDHYHIASPQECSHKMWLSSMMKHLKTKFEIVYEIPTVQTKCEKHFMRSIGRILTPYVLSEPMLFNLQNTEHFLKKENLKCPPMTQSNLDHIFGYAAKNFFGLNPRSM